MAFEWDSRKADSNFRKHGTRFSEVEAVFEDDFALTVRDVQTESGEERFVTMGRGLKGRLLVVVYCYRGERIRIISARPAEPQERFAYENG